MNGKRIGILIRNSPERDLKVVEAMRMGVGLTIRDIEIYLFFLGDGDRENGTRSCGGSRPHSSRV